VFIPLKDDNPTRRFPYVTILLIALNVAVFLVQVFSPEGLQTYVYRMGAIPYEITHLKALSLVDMTTGEAVERITPPATLIVSMFMHGGVFHLFFNMLYLWIFGNNVEDFLGPIRFVLFYLVAGLGAGFTHILFNVNSQVPMIGASGAIAGILGAYLLLFPQARVLTLVFLFFFVRIVPIPAAFVLGLWFLIQVLNVGAGGGVAWFAHIGGFVVGLLFIRAVRKKRRPRVWVH